MAGALWTPENVRELKHHARAIMKEYRRHTSVGWLRQQLGAGVRTFFAWQLWMIDLYPTQDHAPTWKRRRFNELWNSSGAEPPDSEHLSDRALQGIGWVQSSHWWVHFPLEFLLTR